MKRKLIWILVLVALAGGVLAWFLRPGPPLQERRFETLEVTRGPIVAKVTANGALSPTVTVQVGTQVSGRVQELLADFNSRVTRGQVVARIDPQLIQAAVAQARANHAVARANLSRARVQAEDATRQLERVRKLASGSFVAAAEADTAEANARAAKAAVEAAAAAVEQTRAALNAAEVNLAYTTIVSPIDGIVISRNVDVGQTVAATLQAPTLFTIAEDLRKMQVHCNVAEADVGKLGPDMDVTFTVDAWPSERFPGRIREVRNSPQTIQNVVTYDAVIDLVNPDLKLKPGMTANVTIVVAESRDCLRVPNAALRFRPPADLVNSVRLPDTAPDRRTVWVMKGDGPEPVSLRAGISDGTFTEALDGDVVPGDRVVTDVAGGPGNTPPRRLF